MAPSDSEGDLESILTSLEARTSTTEDKVEAYACFTKHLNDDLSFFGLDFSKNAVRIFGLVEKDILNYSETVRQGALQVLGYCLHDVEIVRQISPPKRHTNVISNLCKCIQKTEDKTTCTRALWCLSSQNCPVIPVRKEADDILQSVEYASNKWLSQSVTVEHESVKVIQRLLEQASDQMKASALLWSKIIFTHLVHPAVKVRENAALVLETALPILSHEKQIFTELKAIVKSKIAPELKKMMGNENELYSLQVWSSLVDLFGEDLHHGSFINILLPIVESGFKNLKPEIKSAAFVAWQHLIDNFAKNQNIIGDIKRINLIMQVLKINNAKVESVAETKLNVWWHFIMKLEGKVTNHFDTICSPLLQFCMGGSKTLMTNGPSTPSINRIGTSVSIVSPVTPRMNLTNSTSQLPVFENLQIKGCEILAHFLGSVPKDLNIPHYEFTLDPLKSSIITGPAFFLKQASIFISYAADSFCAVGSHLEDGLVYHIWYLLGAHLKNAVEQGSKSDTREVVTNFLTRFQIVVLSQSLPHNVLLRMFDMPISFPRKILCSTAYGIGGDGKMHGTPALFLTELLLTPILLQKCCTEERYITMLSALITHGISNPAGSLDYCQTVLQILTNNSQFVDKADILYKLWNVVIDPLLEYISKSNEVNQGDSLAPKFDCMYSVLMFPIEQMLITRLSQPMLKTMMKTWTDFYRTFSRLAAMVTNADANISCEDLSHKIFQNVSNQDLQDPVLLDVMVQMCIVIIDSVDFSSVAVNNASNFAAALSPSKWTRRKQKPMGNIHSVILIFEKILESSNSFFFSDGSHKKSANTTAPQSLSSGIIEVLTTLFTHVSSSQIISNMLEKLAKPIGDLYSGSARKSGKVFNNAFQQKLEKLWLDICTCLQGRYSGIYDCEFLSIVSPLLAAIFLHPRRSIKNQTIVFWNATFSRAATLSYPDRLKSVLAKVKEKTTLVLPGWIDTDIVSISETPASQMSLMDSQAPEPNLLGLPSPSKLHGSFMNKVVSPNVKKSPAKPPVIEGKLSPMPAKRKILSVNDMRNEEFVAIKTTPKRKVVLTEHQREVMKERKTLPAMYNSLELSQDVSMMSFYTDSQSTQCPTESDAIVISSQSDNQENKSPIQVEVILVKNSSEEIEDKGHIINVDLSNRLAKSDELETSTSKKLSSQQSNKLGNDSCNDSSSGKQSDKNPSQMSSLNESDGEQCSPSLKQNLLQVISDFPPSTTSTSTGSSGSTSHDELNKEPSSSDENISKSPFPLTIKSQSQSSPIVNRQIQTRKFMSQDSPRRTASKSPHKTAIKPAPTSLDQWLVKKQGGTVNVEKKGKNVILPPPQQPLEEKFPSAVKSSKKKSVQQSSTKLCAATIIEDTVSPTKLNTSVDHEIHIASVTVVEETQSPTKFTQFHQPANVTSADTPEKNNNTIFLNDSQSKVDGARNLFSNSVTETETSVNQTVTACSPVLKIKKLSEQDILKYSPKQSESHSVEKQLDSREMTRAIENLSGKLATVENESEMKRHKHDDFSEIIPLDNQSGSSQGFQYSNDTPVNEVVKDQNDSINNSLPLYTEDYNEEDVVSVSSLVDSNTKEYDPGLDNTLQDPTTVKHKVDDHTDSEFSDVKSCDESVPIKSEPEEKICDLLTSTLNTPKSSKKRKQKTPKKLTPQMETRTKRRKTQEIKVGKLDVKEELDNNSEQVSQPKQMSISSDEEISFKPNIQNSNDSPCDMPTAMNKNPLLLIADQEKTPESKSNSDVPQRKSTTKKKREEAEKRLSAKKNSYCPTPRNLSSDSDNEVPLSILAKNIVKNVPIESSQTESAEESESKSDEKSRKITSARKSKRLSNVQKEKISRKSLGTSGADDNTEKAKDESAKQSLTILVSETDSDRDIPDEISAEISRSVNSDVTSHEEKNLKKVRSKRKKATVLKDDAKKFIVTTESEQNSAEQNVECSEVLEMDKFVELKEHSSSILKTNHEEHELSKMSAGKNMSVDNFEQCLEAEMSIDCQDVEHNVNSNVTSHEEKNLKKVRSKRKSSNKNNSDDSSALIHSKSLNDTDIEDVEKASVSLEDAKKTVVENKEENSQEQNMECSEAFEIDKFVDIKEHSSSMLETNCEENEISKISAEKNMSVENSEHCFEAEMSIDCQDVEHQKTPLGKTSEQNDRSREKVLSLSTKKGRKKKNVDMGDKTASSQDVSVIIVDENSQSQTVTPSFTTRHKSKMLMQSKEPSPVTTRLRSMAKTAKSKLRSQSPLSLRSGRMRKGVKLNQRSSPLTVKSSKHDNNETQKDETEKKCIDSNDTNDANDVSSKVVDEVERVDNSCLDSEKDMDQSLTSAKTFDSLSKPQDESATLVKSPVKNFLSKLQETPVKTGEKPKSVIHNYRRFSDSKLNRGYVMLERSKQLLLSAQKQCRRSILKTQSSPHSPFKSTKDDSFHPILVRHIYSPSCSPSAGILKRRRLSGSMATNSPSPSTKQRRVSFAEPVIAPKTKTSAEVSSSNTGSDKTVCASPDKPFVIDTLTQSPPRRKNSFLQKLSKDESDSQASYKSTLESELDSIHPIFRSLVDCQEPVDQILPQLTSTVWSRGLGQLIRAKNIHTIGHLATLTEAEVQNLPIKSPKVQTVKKALQQFEHQNEAKKLKSLKSDEKMDRSFTDENIEDKSMISEFSETITDTDKELLAVDNNCNTDSDVLPSVDEALSQMDTDSDTMQDTPDELDKNPYSEDIFGTKPSFESVTENVSQENETLTSSVQSITKTSDLVSVTNSLEELSDVDSLRKLGTEEIFQIHQKLTTVMNNVVVALRSKCNSPK